VAKLVASFSSGLSTLTTKGLNLDGSHSTTPAKPLLHSVLSCSTHRVRLRWLEIQRSDESNESNFDGDLPA
jgi:hypothetical protein